MDTGEEEEQRLPPESGPYDSYRAKPLGALGLRVLVRGADCGESGARAAQRWEAVVVGRDVNYVPPNCRIGRLSFRVEFFDDDHVTQHDDNDYWLTLDQLVESRKAYTEQYAAEEMERLMEQQQALAAEAANSQAAKAAAAAAAAAQVQDAKEGGAAPLEAEPKPKKHRGPEGQMEKNFQYNAAENCWKCMVKMGDEDDAEVCGAILRPTTKSDLGAHMRRKKGGNGEYCPFHQRAWRCLGAMRAVAHR